MRADDHKRSARKVDRRTFLKKGALAGGALLGAGLSISKLAEATDAPGPPPRAQRTERAPVRSQQKPNILVILVDQLRYPQWYGPAPGSPDLSPQLQRLRHGAVSFARHYTASNDCTPARAALLTGLYTHQTGCLITGGSTLDPGFPTWGSMLREYGYQTRWYGKWHLAHGDNHWTAGGGPRMLERYGFEGGTYPSPDGAPGQGSLVDPEIAAQFEQWLAAAEESEPWCTTVSFVNPHDIAWWYRFSDRVPSEAQVPSVATQLPVNFETPELLSARRKPRLQRSLQQTAAASFGVVPFSGPETPSVWLGFLDLYMHLQLQVDIQIGRVLDALEARPSIAENTVIIFSADHGEYGASHGLRGKGAGAYEEAIRVPLIVKDPRAMLTKAPERTRTQLSSSVDVAPLLLTIASGSNAWRRERRYAHLAGRLDLARILEEPSAAGRPYVLHATDEIVTEFAIEPYSANAPLHVLALRTPRAKYATYSYWQSDGQQIQEGQERELYDYRTSSGRLELHNSAGENPLEPSLHAMLQHAYHKELRRPLPPRLHAARRHGFEDYFGVATRAAEHAAKRRAEHGPEPPQATSSTSARSGSARRAKKERSGAPAHEHTHRRTLA